MAKKDDNLVKGDEVLAGFRFGIGFWIAGLLIALLVLTVIVVLYYFL